MNTSAAVTALLGIVVVCATAGLFVMQTGDSVRAEYSITYELDGGTNSEDNPSSYYEGETVTLQDAYRYGYSFDGWFSDAELTAQVTEVSGGDVTVYASWTSLNIGGSITYVLDGGTNSEDNKDVYYKGQVLTLSSAAKEGYFFNGWSSSAEHTDIITEIPADATGDYTLYAWWVEIYDGEGFELTYSGSVVNGFAKSTVTGTLSFDYIYYDEDLGFYVNRVQTNTKTGAVSESTYWTSENSDDDMTWSYGGIQTVYSDYHGKEVYCEVYVGSTDTSTETQYIYDGWLPVKIVYASSTTTGKGPFVSTTTYDITYTLTKTYEVEVQSTFSVTAYGDAGITVSGGGTCDALSDVVLTASVGDGYTFGGWYDANGALLSSSLTYTVTKLLSDTVVYAYNTDAVDYTVDAGESFQLVHADGVSDVTWEIVDNDTGKSQEYSGEQNLTFSSGGYFTVYYTGTLGDETVNGFYILFADGYVTKTFTWYYDTNGDGDIKDKGDKYTYSLSILYSDFLYYRNQDVSRCAGTEEEDLAYVTSTDKYVQELAEYFLGKTEGWSDYARMSLLLAFTQYIEYQSDSEYMGQEEYWKFPLETLFDQGGDCEDTSMLYCAIASAMHYESAILLFYGHMAASVELPDGSISEYSGSAAAFPSDDGTATYYYCETTATNYVLGQAPNGYTYNGTYYKAGNMGDVITVPAVEEN